MRKVMISLMFVALIFTGSCGSGGGTSQTLDAAQVATLYLLTVAGTPFTNTLQAIWEKVEADQCSGGTTILNGTTGECENGGTWALYGTIQCQYSEEDSTVTVRINSTSNGQLILSSCASTVEVDINGDDTPDTVSVILTDTITPYGISDSTFTVDMTDPDNPEGIISGVLTAIFTDTQLSGDLTAQLGFRQQLTFEDINISEGTGTSSCAENVVTATEWDETGQCTIQSDCNCL
jgi:hypothetical protein